jgi:chromosome segregation ATPase
MMKPEQIEKRLKWMDEQHRKEFELVNVLERKLGEANEHLEKQEKQIKELSSELTRLSAFASRIQHFDDALIKQRDDFSKKLEDNEQLYSEKQKISEEIRKKDYEELARSISEMQVKQKNVDLMEDTMEARKQEEIRITREMAEIEEKVETLLLKSNEYSRSLHAVDEVRKMDARRTSDLQSESTELRQKIDTIRGNQDSLEDRMRRTEARIDEISLGESSRKELYTMWEEKQELRMVGFEKNWKEWQGIFDMFQEKAKELDEKVLKYDENYRAISKTRSDLDKLIDRLERRITEISEMQRIGEERVKQEWNSFQADHQKRWNTYKLTNDEMWREHNRMHEKITEEIQLLKERLNEGLEALEELTVKSESRLIDLLNTLKVWTDDFEKRVSEIR